MTQLMFMNKTSKPYRCHIVAVCIITAASPKWICSPTLLMRLTLKCHNSSLHTVHQQAHCKPLICKFNCRAQHSNPSNPHRLLSLMNS